MSVFSKQGPGLDEVGEWTQGLIKCSFNSWVVFSLDLKEVTVSIKHVCPSIEELYAMRTR